LLRVSEALASTRELQKVLQTAIDGAVEVLELDTGAIYLLDGESLFLGATSPQLEPDFPAEYRHAPLVDHPHIGRCLDQRDPVHVADTAAEPFTPAERGVADSRRLRSLLFVPLVVDSQPVGTFILGSTDGPRSVEDGDVALCRTLAHQISLAIANARLFESITLAGVELAAAYDATIEGWALTMEMRDEETFDHLQRVVALTLKISHALGFSEPDLVHVKRGALLHDIGKMVVPDSILRKPGPLDENEWSIMRAHPQHAKEFLEGIEYLRPALDIPYCHHERWDGTGYPRGLEGDAIPLSARIFAIVDVFDALTSDRPYRDAWTVERALEYIREQSGLHFDPRVVDAFLVAIAR